MKAKLFFLAGVICLALTSYEFYDSNSRFNTIMEDRNRTNYEGLQAVFFEQYEADNIYHIGNRGTIRGVSILLGVMAFTFFILTLVYTKDSASTDKISATFKKTGIVILIIGACIVTFLNLWSIM